MVVLKAEIATVDLKCEVYGRKLHFVFPKAQIHGAVYVYFTTRSYSRDGKL